MSFEKKNIAYYAFFSVDVKWRNSGYQLRQAGRHEKDIAKSETERLHCHLDVNSRSSRHCRVGYGGQNPRAHRASAAYVRNRHLNCCKNLRYNTADMSNPTSNYDILGCDDVYFYTGIRLGLRRFRTNEVVCKGCWWRAVNVRSYRNGIFKLVPRWEQDGQFTIA